MNGIGRIILDFDNTLFDTDAFKRALSGALTELGVTREMFWQMYPRVLDHGGERLGYSPDRHAKVLHELLPDVDPYQATVLLERVVDRAADFLFPDTRDFLSRMISLNVPLMLLSRGDEWFQRRKIAASGLDRFVHEIHAGPEAKTHRIATFTEAPGKTVLVNDHVEETRDIVKARPAWIPVLKRRDDIPPEKYLSVGMLNFGTLTEIRDFLTVFHATNAHL